MTPLLAALFALSLACDVGGQLCFKLGADRLSMPGHGPWFRRVGAQAALLMRAQWLWVGVAVYGVEFVTWLAILERAPLSLAFPIASLNYCGVLLASRLLLREAVSRRRWLGAVFITLGAVIVGLGAEA